MRSRPPQRPVRIDRLTSALAGAALMAASSGFGATFTVDSLGDFSDDDVSDDTCETINGNVIDGFTFDCSLRGAIEQANATAGPDTIEFTVAGRITLQAALGPLPRITEELIIDGSTAPGAPARDAATALAPVIIIDGENLSDPDADTGLRFNVDAGGSQAINLGVVNFPRDGIFVQTDSASWVTGCWIGVDPETGNAAGNRFGLSLGTGTVGIIVGRTLPGSGRGNVLSGNSQSGLRSEATFALVRGNRIGVDATGTQAIPNLSGGAQFPFGASNDIGEVTSIDANRNVIAGNQIFNLSVSAAGSLIRGNFVGCGLGATIVNPLTGISAIGNDITIGGAADSGNTICNHPSAAAIGGNGADDLTISHNTVTGSGTGVSIANAARLSVTDNTISDSTSAGIALSDLSEASVARNDVRGSATGIRFNNASNSSIETNFVALDGSGIVLQAGSDDNTLTDNNVVQILGDAIEIADSSGNLVLDNLIAANLGAGVIVSGPGAIANELSENRISDNDGPGIDLGGDGPSTNDPGDSDSGPNELQNAPVLSLNGFSPGLKGGFLGPEIDLRFRVDSTAADSAYPMMVEIFVAGELTPDQGETFVVALNYNTPQADRDVLVGLPDGTTGGAIVATAIDADGNTSEFSAPLSFGLPDDVFADGFE